jgi:hypothetical protein
MLRRRCNIEIKSNVKSLGSKSKVMEDFFMFSRKKKS